MRTRHYLASIRGPLLLLTLAAGPTHGQVADTAGVPPRGAELTVYLLTMGPGSRVYERFGHNAIWIRDDGRNTDTAYNYGLFSFEQENFVLRFIRGWMDYWMDGFDTELMANAYIQDDRSVWAQELNLSPAQRAHLRDFLEWNALPENAIYRYDYFRDNCSTRVRDAIDRALGYQLSAQTEGQASGTTYREHMRRLTGSAPAVYAGFMLGLGQPVDREISVWEEMFLPMQLRERIRDVTIADDSGRQVPLVLAEHEVYRSTQPEVESAPSPRTALLLVYGSLFGGLLWITGRYSRSRFSRTAFGALSAVWALLAGLFGLVLLGLWGFTDHVTSYRNENLFFVTPLLLPLAVLLPMAAAGSARAKRSGFVVAAGVAALSLLGFLLQVFPPFSQMNGEVIAFALPVNVALALAAREIARSSRRRERGIVRPARDEPKPAATR